MEFVAEDKLFTDSAVVPPGSLRHKPPPVHQNQPCHERLPRDLHAQALVQLQFHRLSTPAFKLIQGTFTTSQPHKRYTGRLVRKQAARW